MNDELKCGEKEIIHRVRVLNLYKILQTFQVISV